MYNYYDPEWHPYYKRGQLHTMQSVTKSVTSVLIGIAIQRGELRGVDGKILQYFDGMTIANLDDRKRAITVRDLLTMRAGFEWDETTVPYTDPKNSCAQMERSQDWVQFAIDRPMAQNPGEAFLYNSGITELLAHILWKATGKQADDYAAEHLFRPLGISSYYWKRTPTGIPDAEGGLYLTARDLAKIGYLYLNDGVWEGLRILPAGWVETSVAPIVNGPIGNQKYGYHWLATPYEGGFGVYAYAANGYGGQRLIVVPEFNLVAVFTGWNIYETPPLGGSFAINRVISAIGPTGVD
jgi:CubicO group peptidase (beta-lactamase class C family)